MKKHAVIILSAIALIACKQQKEEETTIPGETTETVSESNPYEKVCFLKVIEGKANYDKNKTIRDSIVFKLERTGDSVSGIFNWMPYEKDKKISTFKGKMTGTTGNAIAQYQAEGMNYTEELVFKLDEDQVSIKYGEMVQGENGIWRYKDKESTSTQTLAKVDCN